MAYDTFVIYFLLFPTLSLIAGSLVYCPPRAVRGFLFTTSVSSFFLIIIFFSLETLLLTLSLKSINLYFSLAHKIGQLCWVRVAYLFIIPWFIASTCLLINRIPKKNPSEKLHACKKKKLIIISTSFKLVLASCLLVLYLSFTCNLFYSLRLICLSLFWILLIQSFFIHWRIKNNCYSLYLINKTALLATFYTLILSYFVKEPLYYYEWGWSSSFFEGTLLVLSTYFIASELIVFFSHFWHRRNNKDTQIDKNQLQWLYPLCSCHHIENKIEEETKN